MNMEKIKFDHFKDIEELIQHLEMWYAEDDYYAYDRFFGLRDARIMGMYIYDLQQRIDKAIEYMKPRFMNCIDNEKRYFEDYCIQEIYEILKGDSDEHI